METGTWPSSDTEELSFYDLPLDRDVYLVGEAEVLALQSHWRRYIAAPDRSSPPHPNGFIRFRVCAVKARSEDSLRILVSLGDFNRWHATELTLPRRMLKCCVKFWNYEKRPYLIVEQDWFDLIERRMFALYALVDVVGMRTLLEQQGCVTQQQFAALKSAIDAIAARHTDLAFLTFADNVLVKSNWSAAQAEYPHSYRPERFLGIVQSAVAAFASALGLTAYAIVTQGANEVDGDSLMHVSPRGNHVYFGSLGSPFAELFDIDEAVRKAIRSKRHARAELYLSRSLLLSLRFGSWERRQELLAQCVSYAPNHAVPFPEYLCSSFELCGGLDDSGQAEPYAG